MKYLKIIMFSFLLFQTTNAEVDTSINKLHLGYDHGLSIRIFPKKSIGVGLVVSPIGLTDL